jgi:hypothetical protein
MIGITTANQRILQIMQINRKGKGIIMVEVIHGGNPMPPKVWLRATDIAAEYARCGEAFVAAGRPVNGPVADRFSRAEAEYSQMANAIWFAKWEKWQREEWERIFR